MHFFRAVKLHCLSLQNHFFLKFFGHSVSPGCSEILWTSAFRWNCPNFFYCVLGANWQFALKKFVQWNVPTKVFFFGKVTLLGITHWHLLDKYTYLFCQNNKFCHTKNVIFLVSTGCRRGLICKNIHCWKNYTMCSFSKVIKKLEVKKKGKHQVVPFWKTLDVMFSDFP